MISFRDLLFTASSVLVFSVCSIPVSAIDYDAGQEFSNTRNPNGVWSYRGVTTGTTNLEGNYLLNEHGEIDDTGVIGWIHAWGGDFLSIGNNNGNWTSITLHPGEGEDALFAFQSKAPVGELADVDISVYEADVSGASNGQILSIWKNNTILEGPIQLPAVFEDFDIQIKNVSFIYGDFLFVRIASDEDGIDWGNDSVNFDVLVSTTPVPINWNPPPSEPSSATGIPSLPPVGLAVLSLLIFVAGLRFISGRK